MDNLWIEEQIYPLDCAADYDVPRVASVIAQAHEEELAKMEHRYQQANQMDRDIAGMARLDMEKAQARAALMGERFIDFPRAFASAMERFPESAWHDWAVAYIRQALSAAPTVAARLKMRARRELMGGLYLETTGKDSYLAMGTLRYDETYDVLVMTGEQGQNSEQGYKQARGTIPWHEGDELPEETIARLRGRPHEGKQGQESEQE